MVLSDGTEVRVVRESCLLTFDECCRRIIADANAPALNWCVNYAKAGLKLRDKEERKTQALYILDNLKGWRHADAKCVRESLKQFIARGGIDKL